MGKRSPESNSVNAGLQDEAEVSGLLCLWASQASWASMSFQDTWASWASSMLKAFKKAFNIEEAQEAHVS